MSESHDDMVTHHAPEHADSEGETQKLRNAPSVLRKPQDSPVKLALLEWDRLHDQLREQPIDANGWLKLDGIARNLNDVARITETFEGMLRTYPNSPSIQAAYLNFILDDPSRFDVAKVLFVRFILGGTPSVEVLRIFLANIRRIHTGPNARHLINQCYIFALSSASQDSDSYEIWRGYIDLLRESETTIEESQKKIDTLRRAYQYAVQVPMENMVELWIEYCAFEHEIHGDTLDSDVRKKHMKARDVLHQLRAHLNALLPSPDDRRLALPRPPTFDDLDKAHVATWRRFLRWEESNPLGIEDGNRRVLVQRVQGAYRKAIAHMQYYPEIWYMGYSWMHTAGMKNEAVAWLKVGLETNPASFLLNYTYTEVLETHGHYDRVHATFKRFLKILRDELDANAHGNYSPSRTMVSQRLQGCQPLDDLGKCHRSPEFIAKRSDYGVAWIMYIRFARRSEGSRSAQRVFQEARKDVLTPWEVYEAAAVMEYHSNGAQLEGRTVAGQIFEEGMMSYGNEIEYVYRYLGFLMSVNEESNARKLFERVIDTFPPEPARRLWDRWARYQYQYGDLATAKQLEKRMLDIYPNDPPIKRLAERFRYMSIDSIGTRDMGFDPSTRGVPVSTRTVTITSEPVKPVCRNQGVSFKRPASSAPPHDDEVQRHSYKRTRNDASPQRDHEYDMRRERFRLHTDSKEKPARLHHAISELIAALPPPEAFQGPIFPTEDLVQLLRSAVVPGNSPSS